jgi:hypothetical protein
VNRYFCTIIAAAAGLCAIPATAALAPKVTHSGNIRLSLDAAGTNSGSRTIRANKPSPGATVRAAYMLAASTGFTGYSIKGGDISLDGTSIFFTDVLANSIASFNYWTDISTLVRPKLNAAPAGIVNFTVLELPSITTLIDGESLAVVWDDATASPTTVTLMFGAQSTFGDSFTVTLAQPVDKTNPATVLDMSLGISYGFQPSGQFSILQIGVNNQRISTSAGGQDDGIPANGGLITVGGIGDLNDNPPDPFATDRTCVGAFGPAPRCDDELYNLLPFVADGSTSFTVSTVNPSNDDNIFFAAIILGANTAVVGEGILLSPASASGPINSTQSVTAHVQSSTGTPVQGRVVTFKVVSGPNVGLTGTAATNAAGDAVFGYISSLAGTDSINASMVNSSSVLQLSNVVTRTWTGVNTPVYSFLLEPTDAVNPVLTSHKVEAKLLNSLAQPVSGQAVQFTVLSGPNTGSIGSASTNSQGAADISYISASAGTDFIRASTTIGGVLLTSNTVSKSWLAATGSPSLTLSPTSATNPVNGQHTLEARAYDAFAQPVAGVTVTFNVTSGPNFGSLGTAVTNTGGVATKSYIGHTAGTDTIQASATITGSPSLSNTVSNTWAGLLCDVDNNHKVDNSDIALIFAARNTLVEPGDVRDADFDGIVTSLDARKCVLMCTKANCAQ